MTAVHLEVLVRSPVVEVDGAGASTDGQQRVNKVQ